MAKYRKKPVVIEAVKVSEIIDGLRNNFEKCPVWVRENYENLSLNVSEGSVSVITLEGKMLAGAEDYLIQGIKGEIYPCKPSIFEETYDLVETDMVIT